MSDEARRRCPRHRCPRRAINFVFRLNTRRWDCIGRKFIFRLPLSFSPSFSRRETATLLLASAPEMPLSRTRLQRRFIESLNYFAARQVDGETNRWWRNGCRQASGPRAIFSSNGRGSLVPYTPSLSPRENQCPPTRNDFPRTDSKQNWWF